ncbi:hypothetical protein D9M70_541310 [compost metagenome]
MKHRVRRQWAPGIDTFALQFFDCWPNNRVIFLSKRAAFTRMRVETGNCKAWCGDTKTICKFLRSDMRNFQNVILGQYTRYFSERDVDRDRNRAQFRASKHHDRNDCAPEMLARKFC